MPPDSITLGIDVGTQSTKALAYDARRRKIVAVAAAPHDIIQRSDGTSEQKASWWIAAMDSCLREIPPGIRKSIRAVGVSGQQHGFVPLDETGEVICNVKLWNDTVAEAECKEITRAFGGREKLIAEVGNPIVAGYTAPKVRWLKNHRPDVYKRLAHILLPHDYINYYLTGETAMEPGDASGTGFLNIRTRTWSQAVLRAIDPDRTLAACLPKLIPPEGPSGFLKPALAAQYGMTAGIPISAGGGDNMMAAIGTGCVEEGVFTASLGTSGTLFGFSKKPVIDPDGTIAAFCSSTGGWLPLVCTMNCTVASELTRRLFDLPVKEYDALAAAAPAGSEGLVTVPFYTGERTPNLPNATGTLMGITPQNLTRPHLFRSALESALFGLKYGLAAFERQGLRPTTIHLTGGGAKSPLWRQMAADIFGVPIALPEVEEAAAFGAALQALWTLEAQSGTGRTMADIVKEHGRTGGDVISPEPSAVEAYKTAYDRYFDAVKLLIPHFSRAESLEE